MTVIPASGTAGIKSRLAALFGIQPGEGTPVAFLVTLHFVISVSFVLVQTTAFGLFVGEFGSHDLPFAYLSVALLSSLFAFLYLKLSERVSFLTAQFANLAFLASVCVAFWIGLRSSIAHWFIFFLPFWFQTLTGLANIVVWHSAGHIFNVRQAKRLFGLVGAGNWLANVLGGFVVASILALMGVANTYLLAAVALMLSILILRSMVVIPGFVSEAAAAPVRAAARPLQPSASVLRNPYTRLIFAYTLLWWIAFCFIDNIFFDRAALEFPDSAMLASFLGRQLSVMGVIALITTAFLTSRIVSRYGLRAGLLVMPIVVTASVALLGVGGALGWSTAALFWIAAVAKTLNVALGFSLSLAMGSLLFQPLLGSQRGTAQTIAEGIVQPVAIGIAGLLLLLFNTSLHFDAVSLSYVFIPIALLWLLVIVRLSRRYPLMMSEALRKRALGESSTLLFDPAAREQLRKSLQHPRPGLALYALNQLEQIAPLAWPETLAQELPGLLEHPSPEVRAETLRRVLSLRLDRAIPALRSRLGRETAPKAYSLIVQALATMRDATSEPVVVEALDSPDRLVKRGAILGLLAHGGDQQARRANQAIGGLVHSQDYADRAVAAEILEQCRCSGAGPHLMQLLRDTSLAVRHAAIRAAGAQPDAGLLPFVLAECDNPACAKVAEEVLISRPSSTLQMISAAFNGGDAAAIPPERLRSMIRILGRIHDPRAVELLVSRMSLPDAQLRSQVFESLSALGFRSTSARAILELLTAEVSHAAWLSAATVALENRHGGGAVILLGRALALAFAEARTRALLLLSFVYDTQAVKRAHAAMESASAHQAAIALETVDALLPASVKPLVLPLLEAVSHERRLKDWRAAGLQIPHLSLHAVLSALIGGAIEARESSWTRLCAMDAAVKLGLRSCIPALQSLPAEVDPVTDRMSRWALARLSPATSDRGDGDMLSIVERVLILKSAPLFGETPDNVLADVAGLLEEVSFETDQVVFHKGERGDSLYIIVSGGVHVWDGGRLLNDLREGDVFGELAILDPEPRAATVKASEPSRLLRLDEAHFREVLEARPEVSTAIIRVISRYLRSQLQYAQELNAKLRASESIGSLNPPVPQRA